MFKNLGIRCFLFVLVGGAITACSYAPRTSAYTSPKDNNSAPTASEISAIPVEGFSTCRLLPDDFLLFADIASRRVVPDTESSKEGGRIALSADEMNEWSEVLFRMENVPVPLVIDPKAPRPVFVAVFDGTWNDREVKDEPLTVPGHLSHDFETMAAKVGGLRVKYYHGVGTRVSLLRRLWEGVTGAGTRERAEEALSDLQAFAAREGKLPHVYAIGFSRGAASARHFLNLADKVLLADPFVDGASLDHAHSFALLFDTVATGRTSQLELGIPPTTAAAFHFVATRERRLMFPVVSLSQVKAQSIPGQRLLEVELPGAHSDLGGGYGAGLEEMSLVIARDLLRREGFALTEKKFRPQRKLNMGRHNSDWPGTAAANAILRLARSAGRKRIEPRTTEDSSAEDASRSNLVQASLEQAAREIAASQKNLERIQEANRLGEMPAFDGLSIQLQGKGTELALVTNCPKSVSFDLNSRWLLLDGRPFTLLSENDVNGVKAGGSLIMIFERQDPSDFIPAALHE